VATARGVVRILELTPAGKRPMTAAAFVNGYRIEPGARFAAADQKVGADS
jgi:methionyl-tRNA formyltransferase